MILMNAYLLCCSLRHVLFSVHVYLSNDFCRGNYSQAGLMIGACLKGKVSPKSLGTPFSVCLFFLGAGFRP